MEQLQACRTYKDISEVRNSDAKVLGFLCRKIAHRQEAGLFRDKFASQMTQVEENLRTHLVEIVGTTFSTILYNFRLDNPRSPLPVDTAPESHSPLLSPSAHITTETAHLDDATNEANTETEDEPPDIAQRPFSPTTNVKLSMSGSLHDYSGPQLVLYQAQTFVEATSLALATVHVITLPVLHTKNTV